MKKILEEDLYSPIRTYLESLGYEVKGEVKDCDITAMRDGELLIVELKRSFSLELLYQALERQKYADSVYVAVPLPAKGYLSPHMRDMQSLCRRLSLGLIFVGFSVSGMPQIDVALHPADPPLPRTDKNRRRAVIREHESRTGSLNTGGVTHRKILTAYKEQALRIAAILRSSGPLRTDEIRALGGPENTAAILAGNYSGWFARAERLQNGRWIYRVSDKGLQALDLYADILESP